ncbi:MAG: sigma-54 factor interaction domain-containing protein, partial [Gemmataceae bacterium]|nr:sigma-54 factor interaction domain-containing protein [Gemmataceae bacterium]
MASPNGEIHFPRTQARPQKSFPTGSSRAAAAADVVLGDPDPVRAARLLHALTPELRVVHESRLEDVERHCQTGQAIALVLSMFWPASPLGATTEALAVGDTSLLYLIRTYGQRLAIVVYGDTGHLPLELYCRPLAAGARQVLNERAATFPDELQQALHRWVSDHHVNRHEQEQLSTLFAGHGLLGPSAALRDVFRRAVKASYFSNLPVLLTGETGTGKQRLAEAIHALDPHRRCKALVTLNCSALNKTLAESELFGSLLVFVYHCFDRIVIHGYLWGLSRPEQVV